MSKSTVISFPWFLFLADTFIRSTHGKCLCHQNFLRDNAHISRCSPFVTEGPASRVVFHFLCVTNGACLDYPEKLFPWKVSVSFAYDYNISESELLRIFVILSEVGYHWIRNLWKRYNLKVIFMFFVLLQFHYWYYISTLVWLLCRYIYI